MYDEIAANKRKSFFLLTAFVLLVIATGSAIGYLSDFGWGASVFAFVIAIALAWGSYWKSDAIALSMSRAQPADANTYARLHNIVEGLAIAGGLPKPRVYVVMDDAPNAFATGRNPEHAAIAVTTGLHEKMDRVELEGVIAHELSHVKNYDILVSTIAVTLVGTIALLSDFGMRALWFGGGRNRGNNSNGGGQLALVFMVISLVLLVLSPIVAGLMQAALSRRRESYADIQAIQLTRYPPGLISALEKLQADRTIVHSASRATSHLWMESPLPRTKDEGSLSWLNRLYDTHPPIQERIDALRAL